MKFHEVPWDSMKFHEVPWDFMRFYDVPVNQSVPTEANRGLTSYKKVIGPFKIMKTYSRACLLELPAEMRIFPVFYHSLL
jgi:hypothetical protein